MQPEPADLPFRRQSGLRMSIRLTRLPKHLWVAADCGGEQHPSREESEQTGPFINLTNLAFFGSAVSPKNHGAEKRQDLLDGAQPQGWRKHPTELGRTAAWQVRADEGVGGGEGCEE